MSEDLNALDVRPLLPARDLAVSRDFYVALGWTLEWEDTALVLLSLGSYSLYLRRCDGEHPFEDQMLFVQVENALAWHSLAASILPSNRFPTARLHPPRTDSCGTLSVLLEDPAGVLIHFAQAAGAGGQ